MLAGEKIPKNYFRLVRHETTPGNSGPWSVLKTAANNAQSGSQLTKMLTGYILHPDQPGETAVVNQGSMTALRWKAADHYLDLSRVAGWHEEEQAAKVQAYTNTINNYQNQEQKYKAMNDRFRWSKTRPFLYDLLGMANAKRELAT